MEMLILGVLIIVGLIIYSFSVLFCILLVGGAIEAIRDIMSGAKKERSEKFWEHTGELAREREKRFRLINEILHDTQNLIS